MHAHGGARRTGEGTAPQGPSPRAGGQAHLGVRHLGDDLRGACVRAGGRQKHVLVVGHHARHIDLQSAMGVEAAQARNVLGHMAGGAATRVSRRPRRTALASTRQRRRCGPRAPSPKPSPEGALTLMALEPSSLSASPSTSPTPGSDRGSTPSATAPSTCPIPARRAKQGEQHYWAAPHAGSAVAPSERSWHARRLCTHLFCWLPPPCLARRRPGTGTPRNNGRG